MNNPNDIIPNKEKKPMNQIELTPTDEGEKKEIPNKFFNFLEDEAANMNMGMPFQDSKEAVVESPENNIEVLDDFDLFSLMDEPKKETIQEETIMPFVFDAKENEVSQEKDNNIIEEIKEEKVENIIDPMDSVIKLDPNYDKIIEEENRLIKFTVMR